jgi:hypothetical protein
VFLVVNPKAEFVSLVTLKNLKSICQNASEMVDTNVAIVLFVDDHIGASAKFE